MDSKKVSRKFLTVFLSFFLISNGMCVLNNIDSIWKHLAEFQNYFRPNRSKSSPSSKELARVDHQIGNRYNYYSKGLELYNLLFKAFVIPADNNSSKRDYYKKSRSNAKKENSLFHRFFLSDFMFFYALAEVFLSLFFAFMLIPAVILFRKWIRSIKRCKYKEKWAKRDCLTCEKGEICSICLEDVVDYSELDILGKLDCGHYFHSKCIKEWLNRANTCPFCRKAVDSIVYIELN